MKSTTTSPIRPHERAVPIAVPSTERPDGRTRPDAERPHFAPPEPSPLELFMRDATQRRRWRDSVEQAS